MADVKISQLPAATLPVGGTEVLPIVQSGTTSQVTINAATGITRPFTSGGVVYASSTSALATGSALIFDGSNLGLGVTPSAWVDDKAIQINYGALSSGYEYGVALSSLAYRSSSNVWKYTNGQPATLYKGVNGSHVWFNAPSGTAGNAITFTQALTLNTNGALVLQGGATSASGVGIAFPATQSASSDANTLDDYEEGTFTCTLTASTSGTITLNGSYVTGRYTKVGRQVTVGGFLVVSSVSAPVGVLYLNGLPFTNGANDSNLIASTVYATGLDATAVTAIQARIGPSESRIEIALYTAGSISNAASKVTASTQLTFMATYFV